MSVAVRKYLYCRLVATFSLLRKFILTSIDFLAFQ